MPEQPCTETLPFVEESLFPKTSTLLCDPVYAQAITFHASSRNATMWRSKLDELCCHINPRFDAARLKYYRNRGGVPLRTFLGTISPVELAKLDNQMVKALDLALRRSRIRIMRRQSGWAAFIAHFTEEQRRESLTSFHRQ